MNFLKHATGAAALVAATALLVGGCAADTTDGRDPTIDEDVSLDESTGEAQQPFTNWFWTLDNRLGWSWKVSYSFYYKRWIWNYCYGYNTGGAAWRWCYSAAPYNPENPAAGVNAGAPRPTGSGPANPPAGAPSGPAPTTGAPTNPPSGG